MLSAVVLTKDEEQSIGACLSTLAWADELVVLDSFSQDATVPIAESMGAQVYKRPFRNFADQRNAALDLARGDWVLFVDADERVSEELAQEVQKAIRDDRYAGWWIPRHNYIFGKLTLHSGWYPDHQLRLMRRGQARYDPMRIVHELVILEGEAGYLRHPFVHYNYDTVGQFLTKQRSYASLEAQMMHQGGERAHWRSFFLQPWREFRRRFVTLEGYKDGFHGLVLALLMAYYAFLVCAKLRALSLEADRPP